MFLPKENGHLQVASKEKERKIKCENVVENIILISNGKDTNYL